MWLFLVTEVLFFGGLFLAYMLYRIWYPEAWAEASLELDIVLGAFNTAVLIGSSLTMALAVRAAQTGLQRATVGWILATMTLGLVFLVVKYFEYGHHLELGEYPRSNNFLAIYYTLTGLHMLHVAGGMAVNAYFWGPGAKLWKTNPVWFTNRVEHSGLFWHFVDLVWIFLFPTLYLL